MKFFKDYKIFYLVIFFILTFLFFNLYKYNVIFDFDDLNSTIDSYPLLYEENGRYVCNFLSRVIGMYIPLLLNIHPQDFINSAGAVIFAMILSGLMLIISKFVMLNDEKNYLYPLFSILPIILYINYYKSTPPAYTSIYSFQYGYVLASLFSIAFLYFIYKYIFFEKEANKKNLILYITLGFCAGNSTQIATETTAVVITLLVLYKFAEFKFDFQKFKEFFSNKCILYPVIGFFGGFFLMTACPGFWREVSWRHVSSFNEIIENFIPFIEQFQDFVFLSVIVIFKFILYISIIILIISLIKKQFLKGLSLILAGLFPIIGIIIYYFLTILGGKTFPSTPLGFWVQEIFYHYYYLMILSVVFIFLSGCITFFLKNKYLKYIVSILILFSFFKINPDFLNFSDFLPTIDNFKIRRQEIYKCEKLYIYQLYNLEKNINNESDFKEIIIPNYCITDLSLSSLNNRYINKVYGKYFNQKFNLKDTISDDDNIFDKMGGGVTFTKEEIENAKFQNLYDKNFVCNPKIKKEN